MYNDSFGMVHLVWVLASFVVPYKPTQFLTITVFLPLYLFEFVMVYGQRIPLV